MKNSINTFKTIIIILFLSTSIFAQDGESLFKSKCNACHLLDKNSTGPLLKDVSKKWADAGENALLFDWVKNSAALIAGGKSKMANEIKGFSAMEMPAQEVTKADVDAILAFVDSYAPPVAAAATSKATSAVPEKVVVPNYTKNLTYFYFLSALVIVLLITIFLMSQSITNMVKNELFKSKLAEKKNKIETLNSSGVSKTILSFIAFFGLMAATNNSMALSFVGPGKTKELSPWLLVETSDLYFLAFINLVLVGIVLYLKNLFTTAFGLIYSIPEKVSKKRMNINKIVNDIVPIEEEHTILMHHEYDGIRELDNNLPPWWVWGFIATIIFAVVYLFNFHVFKTSDLQIAAYEKDMIKFEKENKAYKVKMSMDIDETNVTLLTAPAELEKGKALFETTCSSCHQKTGEGLVGPNLTDKNWIYGYDIKEVFGTVSNGTQNNMPSHKGILNPVEIQTIASYVLSLPYTKGSLEPKGDIIEK